MNSKRKMIVAISAFAMLLLATVVAVVAVLAAQQVSVTSKINISYTADANVIGSISGTCKQNGVDTTAVSMGSTTFDGGTTATGTLTEMNRTLTSTNKEVEFVFSFTNTSTVANYTATLSFVGTVTNVTMQSKTTGSYSTVTNTTNLASITVNKHNGTSAGTGTISFKVTLTDSLKDAAFNGTFTLTLASAR